MFAGRGCAASVIFPRLLPACRCLEFILEDEGKKEKEGYAKAMVQKAIDIAIETGMKAIRLDVLGGNIPAERLYQGFGFRYMATLKMYYEDTGWTDFKLYEYVL